MIEHDQVTRDIVTQLAKTGGGKATLPNGIQVEVRRSGWDKVNETIGYDETVIPYASVVERLGVTEKQTKLVRQAAQLAPKNHRAHEKERLK